MSCIHNVDNICKLRHINCCFPSDDCKHYKTLATIVSEAIHVPEEKTKQPYCKYCFNARVYKPTDDEFMDPFATYLTDENDFSSYSVGHCHSKERRFMINSGNGHPVNIEFELLDNRTKEWYTVGKYYPKYCPECGRKLDEYNEVL